MPYISKHLPNTLMLSLLISPISNQISIDFYKCLAFKKFPPIRLKMWIKALGLLVLVSGSFALKGYKILEISPKSEQESAIVAKLSSTYDFLKLTRSDTSQVLVSPVEESRLRLVLAANKIAHKVVNNDVFADVLKDKEDNEIFCVKSRLGTDCYRSHEEINNYIEDLQSRFPSRVHVRHVGYSYERRDLKTILITNGDGVKNKKVIFVDAGMHAREWISPSTGLYVIQQLVENFEENKHLLEKYDWVVMPMINADGYEFTRSSPDNRMWRKTRQPYEDCIGVDPNRNSGFMFGYAGTSDNPCVDTFKGPYPFSEPEVAVLRDVLLSLKGRIDFYLTLHSHGAYIIYPWGYDYIDAPNVDELETVAQAGFNAIFKHSGRRYKVGNSAKLMYPAAGASDDYAYAEAGARISYTMELPSGGSRGFDPPPSDIKSYVEESWAGISAMAEKVIELY
ncbi:hypothetical protein ACFFRR_002834 [Megaselia abdita]